MVTKIREICIGVREAIFCEKTGKYVCWIKVMAGTDDPVAGRVENLGRKQTMEGDRSLIMHSLLFFRIESSGERLSRMVARDKSGALISKKSADIFADEYK